MENGTYFLNILGTQLQIVDARRVTWRQCHPYIKPAITRVGTLIVATIYLQLIQNIYMFRSFTVLQC